MGVFYGHLCYFIHEKDCMHASELKIQVLNSCLYTHWLSRNKKITKILKSTILGFDKLEISYVSTRNGVLKQASKNLIWIWAIRS